MAPPPRFGAPSRNSRQNRGLHARPSGKARMAPPLQSGTPLTRFAEEEEGDMVFGWSPDGHRMVIG
eukprot:1603835-Pyramimonas_sp.AAC.1